MSKVIYFTICSRNYLAYALTLGKSLKRAQPQAEFKIVLADEWAYDDEDKTFDVPFDLIEARTIGLPTFEDMVVRYSIMELNTAIKARAILHLFETEGCDSVVYLDPDIYVVSPLNELEAILSQEVNAVLTPHTCSPLEDGGDPDDVRLLQTGAYNLGFCAFNRSSESVAFLEWWARRLMTDCRVALDEGLFVDQKFMDLAPCYLEKTEILRHAGYNTAYWNIMSRPVRREGGLWRSADVPLRFFHFSGVVPGDPSVFSKHQDRFVARDIGELLPLLEEYLGQIEANGHARWRKEPYAYDNLDGFKLDAFMRRLYREAYPAPIRGVPPRAGDILCLCQLIPGDEIGPARLTLYQRTIWRSRSDLRRAFDITTLAGKLGFMEWLVTSGAREHHLPEQFLPTSADIAKAKAALSPAQTASEQPRLTLRARLSRLVLARLALVRPLYKRLPPKLSQVVRDFVTRGAAQTLVADTPMEKPVQPGIAVYGYFNTESGVGEGARQAFRALTTLQSPVEAYALSTEGVFQDAVEFLQAHPTPVSSAKRVHLFHVNADRMLHLEQSAGRRLLHPDARKIGYWAWELATFPEAWLPAADLLDEVWAPSLFTQESIARAIAKPCHVIPHPAEIPDAPSDELKRQWRIKFGLPQDRFIALNTFDFNSFMDRKNPEAVLDAYLRAKTASPNLALVFKTHGAQRGSALCARFIERATASPDVFLIDKVLTRDDLSKLQWVSDAFISMHRSEGFGLNILEAMARAKPVIATDYSGSKDFVDAEVGHPVRHRLVEVPERAYPFARGQVWADPDVDDAAEALAEFSANADKAASLGAAARKRVQTSFSHSVVAERIKVRLGLP